MVAATSTNSNEKIKVHQYQPILMDPQLFSVLDKEDETDFDGTTEFETTEKKLPIKRPGTAIPVRPWSDFSTATSSMTKRKPTSRSYKYIQLERALTSASLLKHNNDRIQFQYEYLESVQENTFDQFLENYYQKIQDHYARIEREQALKKARTFSFIDLEKNFFALDPTRDIKILFIDESNTSLITKTANARSTGSTNPKTTLAELSDDAATDLFYANRSRRLLNNPARAREEITLFARRAGERLHERLPRMSSVPYRVKIVDERDTTGKPDERTLLQMKHKRALSLVTKRRQLLLKMMTQTKKNQIKMEQQLQQTPLSMDNSLYCRELLERANQIDPIYREEQIRRPQTSAFFRRTPSKMNSSASSQITSTSTNATPSLSSCSTPFQDALSLYHVEKIKNVRVIVPTRPLTAPTKVAWVNYC